MDAVRDILTLAGSLFVFFSLLGIGITAKANKARRNEYAFAMVCVIWLIIAVGFLSWLISIIFTRTTEGFYSIFGYWTFLLPIIGVVILGVVSKLQAKRSGPLAQREQKGQSPRGDSNMEIDETDAPE